MGALHKSRKDFVMADKVTPKITPKNLAAELNITPKRLRQVLRSMTDDRAGKGGVWDLTPEIADAVRAKIKNGVRRSTTPTLKGDS